MVYTIMSNPQKFKQECYNIGITLNLLLEAQECLGKQATARMFYGKSKRGTKDNESYVSAASVECWIQTLEYSEKNLKIVDGIWLDDDATFTQFHALDLSMANKKVDIYRSPEQLMDNINIYPKNVPILLDNNFESSSTHGTDIALELHKLGFTKLSIVSGDKINPSDHPYLTILSKADLDDICKYF